MGGQTGGGMSPQHGQASWAWGLTDASLCLWETALPWGASKQPGWEEADHRWTCSVPQCTGKMVAALSQEKSSDSHNKPEVRNGASVSNTEQKERLPPTTRTYTAGRGTSDGVGDRNPEFFISGRLSLAQVSAWEGSPEHDLRERRNSSRPPTNTWSPSVLTLV